MRIRDWSSDVCSSDLQRGLGGARCKDLAGRGPQPDGGGFTPPDGAGGGVRGSALALQAWVGAAGRLDGTTATASVGHQTLTKFPPDASVGSQKGLRDRKSVVEGKGVSVREDLGGRRINKKKKPKNQHR